MSEVENLELKREVMLKLINALLEGEDLNKIAEIVSLDPNLSVKLLKFINSPYFGLKKEIKSIIQAIAYLGYKNLRDYIFLLLTSSILKNASKEEIKRVIKFAYLMRELAKRLMPEYEDEAFMVGILDSVYQEIGDEIKEILEKAGVSEYVINGVLREDSKLGKLKVLAKKVLKLCDKVTEERGEEVIEGLPELAKKDIVESCLIAEESAESILSIL
ncbi:MAG: histidine kinase [Thermovibrio sp.]|nr:MAG: histidine kinase [Thermovibrio sp.]